MPLIHTVLTVACFCVLALTALSTFMVGDKSTASVALLGTIGWSYVFFLEARQ